MEEKYYSLDLDDMCQEIFHEMERIQDGVSGHTVAFKIECATSYREPCDVTKRRAANRLSDNLVDFFFDKMYLSDKHGTKKYE